MDEEKASGNFRPLRSMTRLLVGGILLGTEMLSDQLRDLDRAAADADPARDTRRRQASDYEEPLPETLPAPQVGVSPKGNDSDLRYGLIGLIFESEEKLDEALVAVKRIGGFADRRLSPLLYPLRKIGSVLPVQTRFDHLARRGQSEVDRWIGRGIVEETNSRQFTQQAANSTVDQSFAYIAQNPAIGELVQTQSVSFARQMLDLVRALSVSADFFLEGLMRYVLRQRPRYLLSPPSPEVQAQAAWKLQDLRHEDL